MDYCGQKVNGDKIICELRKVSRFCIRHVSVQSYPSILIKRPPVCFTIKPGKNLNNEVVVRYFYLRFVVLIGHIMFVVWWQNSIILKHTFHSVRRSKGGKIKAPKSEG